MNEALIVSPDPARMMEGLRDTGYEFNTALADIIDNSIAAGASEVDVRFEMDLMGDVSVYVADNGTGMTRDGLISAMRYGSPQRPDRASLGKFGLGLKTASTAFCRKLSVISRPSADLPAVSATWDLDHVCSKGEWELLLSDPLSEHDQLLDNTAAGSSGTLVVWQNVDRLLKDYAAPGGGFARRAMRRIGDDLKAHLGLVYQRFLDTADERGRNVTIRLNGERVLPWNPFLEGEAELVAEKTVPVEMSDGSNASFRIRAFVLPRADEITDDAVRKAARIGNQMQGIYVYREERLIHGPDWLGMFGKEPHFSLARIEFSFDHLLDDAFHVDIKKSRILLNQELYDWLHGQFLGPPRRAAEERYRSGQRRRTSEASRSAHDASNNAIRSKVADLGTANVEVLDRDKGEVRITNPHGQVTLRLQIVDPRKPGEVHVQPVEGIDDGLLWEPALINMGKAVRINTGHPYYHKVYVPNLSEGVTVQGMDSLMWALCAAELNAVSENTKTLFSDLRYEVSRILRSLVADLPEPSESVDETA